MSGANDACALFLDEEPVVLISILLPVAFHAFDQTIRPM